MKTIQLSSLPIVLIALLAGCATSPKQQTANVCPDCKTVLIEDEYMGDTGMSPIYQRRHTCSGCQGALTTLFKEGKLQHRCTVCSTGGFSCPVYHPLTTKP